MAVSAVVVSFWGSSLGSDSVAVLFFRLDGDSLSSCDDSFDVMRARMVSRLDGASLSSLPADGLDVDEPAVDELDAVELAAEFAAEFEPVDDEDSEFEDDAFDDEDWSSSADAVAAPLAIATPIPSAIANPPTLPTYLPELPGVIATGESFRE